MERKKLEKRKWKERKKREERLFLSSCLLLTQTVTIETFSSVNLISPSTLPFSSLSLSFNHSQVPLPTVACNCYSSRERGEKKERKKKEMWRKEGMRQRKMCVRDEKKGEKKVSKSSNCVCFFLLFLHFVYLFLFLSSSSSLVETRHCESALWKAAATCFCICMQVFVFVWIYWIRGLMVSRNLLDTQNIQSSVCVGVYLCNNPQCVCVCVGRKGRDKGLTVVYS